MKRIILAMVVGFFMSAACLAADPIPLSYAHGVVEKADKDSITILPRTTDGKFAKRLILKVTGTSKINTLSMQKRGGKTVAVQTDTDPKHLKAKQPIAVIYSGEADPVVLSAVVQPAPEK